MAPPATKPRRSAAPASPLKTAYLVGYNVASAGAWALVMVQLVSAVLESKTGLVDGMSGAFAKMGRTTQFVQTLAALEVVHAALGLVRSALGTTLSQVFSRYLMVWYTLHLYPQVGNSPVYATMVFAWAFTEVVRYSFYATGLMGIKVSALETLRYNAFYLLYPMGAGSEAWLILKSAPYAQAKFGDAGLYATYAICAIWPPALGFLMTHMQAQRSKFMKARRAEGKKA